MGRILSNATTAILAVFCSASLFLTFVVDSDIISDLAWHDLVGTVLAHIMLVVLCVGLCKAASSLE